MIIKNVLSWGVTAGLAVIGKNLVKATTPTTYSCSAKIALEAIGFVSGAVAGYYVKDIIVNTAEDILKKDDKKEDKK